MSCTAGLHRIVKETSIVTSTDRDTRTAHGQPVLCFILNNKHAKRAEASRRCNKFPDAYSVGTRTEFQRKLSVGTLQNIGQDN